jgi:hypothetical protein
MFYMMNVISNATSLEVLEVLARGQHHLPALIPVMIDIDRYVTSFQPPRLIRW